MNEPSTDTSQISSLENGASPESSRPRGRRARRRRTYSPLGWLWGSIPGPLAVRALIALAVLAAAVLVLFNYGFPYAVTSVPWVHDWVVGTGGTVEGS